MRSIVCGVLSIFVFIIAPAVHADVYTSDWADRWANESGLWWFQCIGYNPFWSGEFETVENVGENIVAAEPFFFTNPLGRYAVHFDERLNPTDMGDEMGIAEFSVPAGETALVPAPSTGYYGVYTDWADGSTSWIEDRDWACLDPNCDTYGWGPPADAAAFELHEMAAISVNTAPATAVQNPGFELWTGTLPDGWTKESSVTIAPEAVAVYDGSFSISFETSGTSNRGVYQDVAITGGAFYVFSAWLYSATEADDMGILISWYDASMSYISYRGPFYPEAPGVWELVSVIGAKAPADAAFARVRVRGYGDGVVCGYADLTALTALDCTDVDDDRYAIEGGDCGSVDCNDADETINPGAVEECLDGINSNCDPEELDNDRDADHDGFITTDFECGGDDCDDTEFEINPGIVESLFEENCADGLDNDCDEEIDIYDPGCIECADEDGDGYGFPASENCTYPEEDCDDFDAAVNPGMTEDCGPTGEGNGIDDDCNGLVDEGCGGTHNIALAFGGGPSSAGGYLALFVLPLLFMATWRGIVRRW